MHFVDSLDRTYYPDMDGFIQHLHTYIHRSGHEHAP